MTISQRIVLVEINTACHFRFHKYECTFTSFFSQTIRDWNDLRLTKTYTPTLRYRGCYVTDVFAYLMISSVLRALTVFNIRDPTTENPEFEAHFGRYVEITGN